MSGQTFIDTDRLELRTIEETEKKFARSGLNHPKVRRYIQAFRTPTTATEYDAIYEGYDADPDTVSLLVVPKEGDHADEPIGSVQLAPIDDARGWANLGTWLHPTAWGNGYATEACAAIIGYGFSELRLHRITAAAHAINADSIGLCERLGFVHEGTNREDVFCNGEYVDRERYAILDHEWNGQETVLD